MCNEPITLEKMIELLERLSKKEPDPICIVVHPDDLEEVKKLLPNTRIDKWTERLVED